MTYKLRYWKYITNSKIDLIDFWCSITLFISGIFLMFQSPESFSNYTYFGNTNITRNVTSILFSVVGALNIIKLFVPVKLPVLIRSSLKSLNFSLFVLLSLCEVAHFQSFPLTLVFYTVFSGMSFQNLLKDK